MPRKKPKKQKPYIIGIAGGTASGKTAIAEILKESYPNDLLLINHDNYYKEYGEIPKKEAIKKNYDYPGSIDNRLFIKHLRSLISGKKIQMPRYNFFTHSRAKEKTPAEPRPVIIVEGILALSSPQVRKLLDLKIFIEADTDVRLARRLERDLKKRDKSLKYSINQYLKSAAPMYKLFVEPTKRYANIVVNNNGTLEKLETFLDLIETKIDQVVKENQK
ncbi:uridine kinase [Patescibacteria group bacterium]